MPSTQRNDLTFAVYAPVLVGDDDRPLAIVHGMERALPGLSLEWTISKEGKLVPLVQRDAWVAGGRPTGRGFPLVCNGGEENDLVTLYGLEVPASFGPGGLPLFDVHADLPLDAANAAAEVLEAI